MEGQAKQEAGLWIRWPTYLLFSQLGKLSPKKGEETNVTCKCLAGTFWVLTATDRHQEGLLNLISS